VAKRRVRSQSASLTPNHKKSRITLKYVCAGLCHISLESYWRGLQLWFKPHLNQRFSQEVMAFQSARSLNFESFRTRNLGVSGQNDIWMQLAWIITKNIIMGKVVASPKFGPWWVLWVCVYLWLVRAPKVL